MVTLLSNLVNVFMFILSLFGFAVVLIAGFKIMAIRKELRKTNVLLEELLKEKKK